MIMVVLTELLPGSSFSSSTNDYNHRYDVFLSFRGADTRNHFTDHLYNALLDAGIITFLDDQEIETGEPLKAELETAIRSSRASIIVLSKNYASSTWCLDELVLILEQKVNFKQIVIPIFYDIEPTYVRKQQSSFGEAMAKHKQKMETETNAEKRSQWAKKIELWKIALTQVANLKGKDAKNRKETEFIREVVIDVHRRLGVSASSNTPKLLVGVDYEIRIITSWLTDGSCHTADILTIVGMGGIGKTSLARYVFRLHSGKFDKSSFIEGINTRCNQQFNGLLDLQKQLHGDISKELPIQVNDVFVYTSKIENALVRKSTLVVLDDICSLNQLDSLLGNKGLHPGSKIIITTNDASITKRYALSDPKVQPKHTMITLYCLSGTKSLELLCIHAFKSPKLKEGYEDVSKKLLKYCEGHPLALEVLGKSLYNRDLGEWEDFVEILKKEPISNIKKVLQLSFDTLPFENDKDLFKHIACFFVGIDRDLAETILNACDIHTRSGIRNLIDRCLLSMGWNNKLMMHSLIQEMGRDLVRQESPNKPWKRSRLWCHEESFKVLKQKRGKGSLLGLALDMRMLDKKKLRGSFELTTDSLSKMDNLMLLQLNYVQLNGCFKNFPKELRWLCMHGSPLKSIPLDLPMENLVALDMSYSSIESFDMSKHKRLLASLKILDLSFCEHLRNLGGFFELRALERLILRNCTSLIEVCESVGQCVELVLIDLCYCYKLKKIPTSIGKLKKVKTLLLDGCNSCVSQIEMWDKNSPDFNINSETSSSAIMEAIPSNLKLFSFSLPSLRILSLANNNLCNKSFPGDLSCLSMLEELYLDDNPIVSMPSCVRTLPRLEKLSMQNCEMIISIDHPPRTLRELSVGSIKTSTSLRKIKFDPEMSALNLLGAWQILTHSSFEIDGMVKVQPLAGVEEKLLLSLGWKKLEFIKERHLGAYTYRGLEISQTQMYYEFGIFSTIYEGCKMPDWINHRSKGSSVSFIIPLSCNKLRGLNFCFVETYDLDFGCVETVELVQLLQSFFVVPVIKVSNITRNHTWIYDHSVDHISFSGKCLTLLSHWMFGPNEMEGGDLITITVAQKRHGYKQLTKKCGVRLVYNEDRKNEEEEDVLSYYKSWNHIIGGDLSPFQLTTGEYILSHSMRYFTDIGLLDFPFVDGGARYKEEASFKAFSRKKSNMRGLGR